MIDKITLKNKNGDSIDFDFEEIQKLKLQLYQFEQLQHHVYPDYCPTTINSPFWQISPVTCTSGNQ